MRLAETGSDDNKYGGISGLQISVGHGTFAKQNLPVSDKIQPVFGQYVRRMFIS